MAAIQSSELPGFKHLREKVINALGRCQETPAIEFKESLPWETVQFRIIRTVMGMSNLRDGGQIIIGVSERDETWTLTGISEEHLATFDCDNMIEAVNKYASPNLSMDVVTVCHEEKRYLVIGVREFIESPTVCKRDGHQQKGPDGLCRGTVYVRPYGKPQTRPVQSEDDIRELLDLAAEKRARKLIETASRVGLVQKDTDTELFKKELDGL